MNINGLGNLYDRTDTTYRTSKYAQSRADFLDKFNEMKDNTSDSSVKESTEEKTDSEKDIPDEGETRTEVVVKPDGSKVLMITVTVGGQEAVTSVELSKPTEEDANMGANPSFAKVTSYEEIMRDWEEQVKTNLKKYGMTTEEAMLAADPQARERMYRIVGSSKLYTFNEFVRYIDGEHK